MDGGTQALLDGADGALDFADVAVGSDDVDGNGVDVGADAVELVVSMEAGDLKTASLVTGKITAKFGEDGAPGPVRDASDGTVVLLAGSEPYYTS